LKVELTRRQVEASPEISVDEPVSRQMEEEMGAYYGWPYYWGGFGLWGYGAYPVYPAGMVESQRAEARAAERREQGDPHLRSVGEVTGYAVQAEDGEIGRVSDFLVDEETWAIRYLALDTGGWWSGRKVLLPPQWIQSVRWDLRDVAAGLRRDTIRQAPAYEPDSPLTREYEARLHAYYRRPPYWEDPALMDHWRASSPSRPGSVALPS
jgi:hypothetical protein